MKASRRDTVRVHNRIGTVLSTSKSKAKVEFDTGYVKSYPWELIHKTRQQPTDETDDYDEETKYICVNHKPDSAIFHDGTLEEDKCPICKTNEFVACYSGKKAVNWKKVKRNERNSKKKGGVA